MATTFEDNGDGSFTLVRDDGYRQAFMDPDGSLRAELSNMSGAGTAAPARGYIPETNAFDPRVKPVAAAAPIEPPAGAGFSPMSESPGALASNPAINPEAAAAATAPAMATITIPGTPGSSKTTVQGPSSSVAKNDSRTDKDPDGTIAAAGEKQIAAQREANTAAVEAKRKAIDRNAQLIEQGRAHYQGQIDQATHLANIHEKARDEALAQRKTARQTPIDPSLALADGAGALALGAVIGSAIENVGLAWMGQSAKPINIIDNLVNRSLTIQRDQKQNNVDEASESVEFNRAELASAKANARVAVSQLLENQMARAENDNQRSALDALMKDNEAKLAAAELEYATAVADEVTTSRTETHDTGGSSTTTESGTPETTIQLPAGSSEEQAADAVNAARFDATASEGDKKQLAALSENVTYTNERQQVIDELERLEKNGTVSDVVGLWQAGGGKLSEWAGTQKYALTPEQNRAKDLLAKLEGLNRFSWKTEPNSVKTQERMANLGLPTNDRDLPTFFARQKEAVKSMRNADYLGYDDKVVGKFRTGMRKVDPTGEVESF